LKCSGYYKADFLWWLAWELGKDVAELFLMVLGDTHAPEAVFDVKFAEENGPLGCGLGADSVNDAA
jgi:hypothetical protein